MAKLWADITYKRCKQESVMLKSAFSNIELEQQDNLDEQNKEADSNNINENELNFSEPEDDDDMDDEDNVNIEDQFQNQINQFLEIDDIDIESVESIEHPAQNKDAKWELDTMFIDDLCCPF